MSKHLLLPFFLFVSTLLHAGALDDFLNSDNLKQAGIGFLLVNMENGEVVAEHQPDVCRNPASVTKLLTTATAMELLSDTFRFQTTIEYAGEIYDSVLCGNLYIRGGGDPTLESPHNPVKNRFFSSVLDTLQKIGIKTIDGKIIGDASLFREDGSPSNWLVEDVGSSYSPTPSCLSACDNLLSFVLTSDTNGFSISKMSPYTPLFQPVIEATQNENKTVGWRFTKSDFSWNPIIRGNFPLKTAQFLKTELSEPAYFVADSLRNLLIQNNISVTLNSTTTRLTQPDSLRTPLYVYRSATLRDIERMTNYKSINLFAENIFLTLSLQKDTQNPCTSWRSSLVVSNYWKSKKLESDRIFQVDGSGMSTKNAISPRFLVDMLTYMYNESPYSQSFLSTLPIAGKSGTVASLMKGTPLEGKVYVKSGSMERVKNYAGYIFSNGKSYAFCVMVSNFSGTAKQVMQQIGILLNGVVKEDKQLIKQK